MQLIANAQYMRYYSYDQYWLLDISCLALYCVCDMCILCRLHDNFVAFSLLYWHVNNCKLQMARQGNGAFLVICIFK